VIAAQLKDLGIRQLGPCHCTGERAIAILAEEFSDCYIDVRAGTKVEI
jgi:metal-dependent hydrolase (beta-lactamase superfamily II)